MSDYIERKSWKMAKQQHILEAAYRLFSEYGIAQVSIPEVAEASGVGRATVFRYFPSKAELVIEVATWKWAEYFEEYLSSPAAQGVDAMTGAEYMRFYLDAFLDLYRRHPDILRFNYELNSFFRHEPEEIRMKLPFGDVAEGLNVRFQDMYDRGVRDGTVNTDYPERVIFSSTYHIMLASATRYAVGLIYTPEGATTPEAELQLLEEMLLRQFTRQPGGKESSIPLPG